MFELNQRHFVDHTGQFDLALVPWDTKLLGKPVAQLSNFVLKGETLSSASGRLLADWLVENRIGLCATRVSQQSIIEIGCLQQLGFRFIELNFNPLLKELRSGQFTTDHAVSIVDAETCDEPILRTMAQQAFPFGRFHQDHRIGAAIGNVRYGQWVSNSFENLSQRCLKIIVAGEIIGFFIIESPAKQKSYWSLTAIAPGVRGRSLGYRIWTSMLAWEAERGITVVETSISSHNVPVMNLYVKLGFRFPPPSVTLHWMP